MAAGLFFQCQSGSVVRGRVNIRPHKPVQIKISRPYGSVKNLAAHEQIDRAEYPNPMWLLLSLSSVCVEAKRLYCVSLENLLMSLLKMIKLPILYGTLIAVLRRWECLHCQYNYYTI